MKRKINNAMFVRILLIILTLLCMAMGLHYFKHQFGIGPGLPDLSGYWPSAQPSPSPLVATSSAQQSDPALSDADTVERRLAGLLALPLLVDDTGIASSSVSLQYIGEKRPLMVTLFGTEIPATVAAAVVAQLRQLPVPPVVAVDHEGGTVQRLSGEGFTQLPSWRQLCSMAPEARKDLMASSAAELAETGIDVVLAPVLDLTASGSALGTRTCASTPATVATVAQEFVDAYTAVGIVPVLKHFPGIGSARVDLHTQSAKVTVTPQDTQPFETLLTANPPLPVMLSHLRVEPSDPGTPCSLSYLCVGELHRAFPESLLVSDALEMYSAGFLATSSAVLRPLPERAVATLRAGADVALFGPTVSQADIDATLKQLQKDLQPMGQLERSTLEHITRTRQWRASLRSHRE